MSMCYSLVTPLVQGVWNPADWEERLCLAEVVAWWPAEKSHQMLIFLQEDDGYLFQIWACLSPTDQGEKIKVSGIYWDLNDASSRKVKPWNDF